MTTLAELRALAEAAPSWAADDPDPQYGEYGWYISGWPLGETDDTEPGRATARLYGALSPEVVKALLAVAEAAEARRERDDSRLRLWLAVGECGHQDGEACPELEAIAVDDPSEEGRISGALSIALDALKAALA